uniref:F-box domain-containing protein n=1 Tax=Mycena chlorophos TaxID=658473 RepID=A0ABQ0L5H3_MYCCL|nr:predicted protein [Mycena chlorophos]
MPTDYGDTETLFDSVLRLRNLSRTAGPGHDTAPLQKELATKEVALGRLDAAIEHQREVLRQMEADRETLHWCIEACRSLVAPIRRLPDEILAEILVHVPRLPNPLLSVTQPHLLRLAAVCSRWRSIVYATPALWQRLTIDLPYTREFWNKLQGKYLPAISRTLRLSGQCTLSVEYRQNLDGPVFVHPEIVHLLEKSAPRWRHLHLSLNVRPAKLAKSLLCQGQLSSLRTASIFLFYPGPAESLSMDLFGPSPALQHLELCWQGGIHIEPFPWNGLKSLRIRPGDSAAAADMLTLLSAVPNTTRDLHVTMDFYLCENALQHHRTSHVRSLDVRITRHSLLRSVLTGLTLPNLHSLRLTAEVSSIPLDTDAFLSFCQRSSLGDTLTSLDITSVPISSDDALRCLEVLHALESLAVADHPVHDEDDLFPDANMRLVDNALLRQLVDPLVPRLRRLEMTSAHLSFNPRLLFDLVVSRGWVFELGIGIPAGEIRRWGARQRQLAEIKRTLRPLVEEGVLRWLPERTFTVPNMWKMLE